MTGNRLSVLPAMGDYDLLAKIGAGGICEVYQARHRQTEQVVAIKILPSRTARNEVYMRRFEQEFRVANRLEHPNIVRALDFHDLGDTPFLVMEYVVGVSLGEKIERDGKFSEKEAINLIIQACRGLQYAHSQGVIHRDIKPDNLLLTPDGQVKITDFGLVKELLDDQGLTRTGRGLGTPHYMPPEQFRDAKMADRRADIYSLGATLYSLVTGKLPFAGISPVDALRQKLETRLTSPRSLVPTLSARTEKVILRAMQADPDNRQADCDQLIQELLGQKTKVTRAKQTRPVQNHWYVAYENHEGQRFVLRQTLAKVRQGIQNGLLRNTANVQVSRSEKGPFHPVEHFVELQDLLAPDARVAQKPAQPVVQLPSSNSTVESSSGDLHDAGTWIVLTGIALTSALAGYYLLR